MSVAENIDMRLKTCRHFHGIQHKVCGANVILRGMRDVSQPGMARWPCLTIAGREQLHTCPQFSPYTPEEVAAENEEMVALLERFSERMARGECGQCGRPATFELIGSCKYARPCGCRIGHVGGDEP